jgi:hypothetical protein
MHDAALHSGWDTALVAVPFLIMLAVGFFHLDEVIYAPKKRSAHRRPPAGVDADGSQILCDPDGRRWRPAPNRK